MTTALTLRNGPKLVKTGAPVRQLAVRLERALQSRNEKVARADAEYVDAVRRATASFEINESPESPVAQGDTHIEAQDNTPISA